MEESCLHTTELTSSSFGDGFATLMMKGKEAAEVLSAWEGSLVTLLLYKLFLQRFAIKRVISGLLVAGFWLLPTYCILHLLAECIFVTIELNVYQFLIVLSCKVKHA